MLLGERLALRDLGPYRLVVCGGAALIAQALVARPTTRDVDVVALMDQNSAMVSPDPLPKALLQEATRVAIDLDLPEGWLNSDPSKKPGGLFQLGLPDGLDNGRCEKITARNSLSTSSDGWTRFTSSSLLRWIADRAGT